MRSPCFSLHPLKDEDIEDSATVKGDSYDIRGVLFSEQDKKVHFDNNHEKVYDQPTAQNYQSKISTHPKS